MQRRQLLLCSFFHLFPLNEYLTQILARFITSRWFEIYFDNLVGIYIGSSRSVACKKDNYYFVLF